MKSVKVIDAIKPECVDELNTPEMHRKMEKYKYDLNLNMLLAPIEY